MSWKKANVVPIFKKSDPSNSSDYRPISLLSCLRKFVECCVHKYLYNYVQSGFITGDSTINQLTFIYNDICKALDQGNEVRAVFCDISKAFDQVWHRSLLFKLSSFGIHGELEISDHPFDFMLTTQIFISLFQTQSLLLKTQL